MSLDAARTSACATMRLAGYGISIEVSDDELVFALIYVGPDASTGGDFAGGDQRRQRLNEQSLHGAL